MSAEARRARVAALKAGHPPVVARALLALSQRPGWRVRAVKGGWYVYPPGEGPRPLRFPCTLADVARVTAPRERNPR